MTIKEVCEKVETFNEVRRAIGIREVCVTLSIDDEDVAEECTGFGPLDVLFNEACRKDFVEECYKVDLKKTYSFTMGAYLYFHGHSHKIALFIDF